MTSPKKDLYVAHSMSELLEATRLSSSVTESTVQRWVVQSSGHHTENFVLKLIHGVNWTDLIKLIMLTLLTVLGRSVGVTTATKPVWVT